MLEIVADAWRCSKWGASVCMAPHQPAWLRRTGLGVEVMLDRLTEIVGAHGLRHLRQCFDELAFNVVGFMDVVQEKIIKTVHFFHCGPPDCGRRRHLHHAPPHGWDLVPQSLCRVRVWKK